MKKILCTLLAISSISIAKNANAQATWNGSADQNWNNPSNWTWESGTGTVSGVPNINTNVILTYSDMGNSPTIESGDTAYCKNLSFTIYADTMPVTTILMLMNNATLNVSGNISSAMISPSTIIALDMETSSPALSAKVNFVGSTETQSIDYVNIYSGKLNVANPTNVTIISGSIIVFDSLKFSVAPVPIGEVSNGNLVLNGGYIMFNPLKATIPTYTNTQNPPHIITTARPNSVDTEPNGYIALADLATATAAPITGNFSIPIGPNYKSFTPIDINSTTPYVYLVSSTRTVNDSCLGTDFLSKSVLNYYDIIPAIITPDTAYAVFETAPLTLSMSYSVLSATGDVATGYDASSTNIYTYNKTATCYEKLSGESVLSSDGNYRKVTRTNHTQFPNLILSQKDTTFTTTPAVASVVVSVTGGGAAAITTPAGTLPLTATILPAGAPSEVTWSLVPGTGAGTISATGVVTASANGTVTAKATSVSDPTKFGTLSIEITNQPTSINNQATAFGVTLSPNPTDGKLLIAVANEHPRCQLSITDALGKVVYTKEFEKNELNNVTNIDAQQLASGLYFLHINGAQMNVSLKFSKK